MITGKTSEFNIKEEEPAGRAMELWDKYAAKYRELVPRYEELLAIKRTMKISPLNVIKKSTLKEISGIDFLEIDNDEEASEYVGNCSFGELKKIIKSIELLVDGYAWHTTESHICDYEYEIAHRTQAKSTYGDRAERCRPLWQGKRPKSTPLGDSGT